MKPLTQELILKYQRKHLTGKWSHQGDVVKDEKNRIVMPLQSVEQVIVVNHLKNGHLLKELNVRSLSLYKFIGIGKDEMMKMFVVYRSSCLHCKIIYF